MKKQLIFLLIIIFFYLLFIPGLMSDGFDYRLTANVFNQNKVLDYLAQLIYLDEIHSKLVLREGLPVVRVAEDKSELNRDNSTQLISLACEFITDLPPSFFQVNSPQKIEQVAGDTNQEENLDQQTREKMRAEGTHEDEETEKVKLDFWQTDPSSSEEKTAGEEENDQQIARDDSEKEFSGEEDLNERLDLGEGALVGLYHSHTSENYENRGHKGNAFAGERGDIVDIGNLLKEELEKKYGIPTVHSSRIHDKNYSQSYLESLETSKRISRENPNLEMLFDLHRDALGQADKDRITTTINGESTARILIIVTSNDYLPNPYWRENLEFATDLAQKMEEMYPGLLREVELINNRRYNQHIQPGSLLIEIGGVRSTIPEAERSVRLFAEVIAALVQEQNN